MRVIIAAAIAGAALAGVAGAAQPAGEQGARQCFYLRDVTSWREVGDRQVNVQVNNRDLYRLDLVQQCPQLRFVGQTLAIEQSGVDGPICSGIQADIRVPGQGAAPCPVQSIRKYSAEEVQALPRAERP